MIARLAPLFLAGLLLAGPQVVSAQIYSRADAREGAFARTKIAEAYVVVVNRCLTHVPEGTDLTRFKALVARYEALRETYRRTPRAVDFEIIESEYDLQRVPDDYLEIECGPRGDPEALVLLQQQTDALATALGPLEEALQPAMADDPSAEAFDDMMAEDVVDEDMASEDIAGYDAVALEVEAALANESELEEYAHPFDGEWNVDLRLDLADEPYFQPMQILVQDENEVTGTFYGSTIEQGRAGDAQGRTCMAFRTQDGSGPYQHAACLVDDLIVGQSWSEGRDFVNPWTAERKK